MTMVSKDHLVHFPLTYATQQMMLSVRKSDLKNIPTINPFSIDTRIIYTYH